MTFTHDDIKDRLIEFLYGELEGDARVAFDAHVTGCPQCRGDVDELRRTRELARAAVRVGLQQPVPSALHARVLEAAAAAAAQAASATAATNQGAKITAKATAKKADGGAGGPWAWLRARWAVPMFATVAAMGALLLARESIFREARKPLGEASAPVVRPMAPTAPTAPTAPPGGAGSLSDRLSPPAESQAASPPAAEPRSATPEKRDRHRASVASASTSRKASADKGSAGRGSGGLAPASSSPTKEKVAAKQKAPKSDLDDLLEGALSSKAAANRAPTKPASNDGLLSGVGRGSQRQSESPAAPKKSSADGFAQPPPPVPTITSAPAPAPAAKRAQAPRMQKESSARAVMGDDERESPLARDEAAPAAAPVAAASSRAEEASESDAESTARPDPAAPLMARAEGLMASRRWAEAAAAYRSLIARFPRHEQVPNWKRRLSVVESAARQAPSGSGFATPPPPK